jgi:outer membrane protein assembly factor BamD (BamD/ComL family)
MNKIILIMFMAFAMTGCITQTRPAEPSYRSEQEWKLSRADLLLQEGNITAASQVLAHIAADPFEPGVTDEALFRLSLIHLGAVQDSSDLVQTQKELKLLVKRFPKSSWAPMASRVIDLLSSMDDALKNNGRLKKTNLNLTQDINRVKELNLALAKENSELRRNIEKLKSLELELGKGTKR